MADSQGDIRQLVVQLGSRHFKSYLSDHGWEEKPSRYVDYACFEILAEDGVDSYELFLPLSTETRDYRSRIMRVLYKLSGIEGREPHEIAESVLACIDSSEPESAAAGAARLKIRNSGPLPLQIQIDAPARVHELLPGEAVELSCELAEGTLLEIDRNGARLTVCSVARN